MKRIISIILTMAMLCITSVTAYAQPEKSEMYNDIHSMKAYDPLLQIQQSDNCKLEKQNSDETLVTLSDGTESVYKKMDSDFGGIKYNVTEGDLHATLEITKDDKIYLNGELVEYNEGEVEEAADMIQQAQSGEITPKAGGWIKWTTYPIWGKPADYNRTVKTIKKGNIRLKNFLMSIPYSTLLTIICKPLHWSVKLGVAVAKATVSTYAKKKMNPKSLYYDERVNKYGRSDHATQYRTIWVNKNGKPLIKGMYQFAYCTIG